LRQCIQGFWGTVYNHILSLLVSTMCWLRSLNTNKCWPLYCQV
jgi:hypothetical protein